MSKYIDFNPIPFLTLKKHTITCRNNRAHSYKLYSCIFVLNGNGKVVIGKKESSIGQNDCLMIRPGMKVHYLIEEDKKVEIFFMQFCIPDEWRLPLFQTTKLKIKNMPDLFTLLKQLERRGKPRKYSEFYKQQSLLLESLALLHEEMERGEEELTSGVEKTIAYMEKHFSKDIYVGLLSEIAGMTLSSYSRAFKKMTGQTPSEYLTALRINHAKEILNHQSFTLREVAQRVGFQDEFYFSRLFKKREGISPTIFSKQQGERIAVVSQMFLQDHLLSLGIQPVAAPCYPNIIPTRMGFPSYLGKQLKGTKAINVEKGVQLEEVLQVCPDLILKTNLHGEQEGTNWERSKNTVYLDHLPTWENYLMEIATHTSRTSKAEQIIEQMSLKEKEARDHLLPFTRKGKWAIVWVRQNDVRLYGQSGHALCELLYSRLGFTAEEGVTHSGYKSHALEELIDINPENILFLWTEPSIVEKLKENRKWQELRALRNNKVFCPNSIEWDPWGPIGREIMIQECVSYFSHLDK